MFYYFRIEDSGTISKIDQGGWVNTKDFIHHIQQYGFSCEEINENVYKAMSWSAIEQRYHNTEFISDSEEELERFRKKLLIENL